MVPLLLSQYALQPAVCRLLGRCGSIVGTNTTYLSNAVNRVFGCNLRCLINCCRIEYAKSLLENRVEKMNSLPVACGFASKSAFYASFKRLEGVTPAQYMLMADSRDNEVN